MTSLFWRKGIDLPKINNKKHLPNVQPNLLDLQVRFKVQFLTATKVCDVHSLLGHLVYISEEVPCPLDGLQLE